MPDLVSLTFSFAAFVLAGIGLYWYRLDRKAVREGISRGSEALVKLQTDFTPEKLETRVKDVVEDAVEEYAPRVATLVDARAAAFKADMLQEVDARVNDLMPQMADFAKDMVRTTVGGFELTMQNMAKGVAMSLGKESGDVGREVKAQKAYEKNLQGFSDVATKELAATLIGQGDPLRTMAVNRGLELAAEHGVAPEDALQIGQALMAKFMGGNGDNTPAVASPPKSSGGWGR